MSIELKDVRTDLEWKGYVSATLQSIAKNQEDLKEQLRCFMQKVETDMWKLKVRVASWAAIFGALSAIIIALITKFLGG